MSFTHKWISARHFVTKCLCRCYDCFCDFWVVDDFCGLGGCLVRGFLAYGLFLQAMSNILGRPPFKMLDSTNEMSELLPIRQFGQNWVFLLPLPSRYLDSDVTAMEIIWQLCRQINRYVGALKVPNAL